MNDLNKMSLDELKKLSETITELISKKSLEKELSGLSVGDCFFCNHPYGKGFDLIRIVKIDADIVFDQIGVDVCNNAQKTKHTYSIQAFNDIYKPRTPISPLVFKLYSENFEEISKLKTKFIKQVYELKNAKYDNSSVKGIIDKIYSEDKPESWREGQFVFNRVEELYGSIARKIQFEDGVDCFYDNTKINAFIDRVAYHLNN